jgi:NAD dependent epimerase/dehydratase family enzyme
VLGRFIAVSAEISCVHIWRWLQVVAAINSTPKEKRPSVLVSSTAVGFYGNEIYLFMAQD